MLIAVIDYSTLYCSFLYITLIYDTLYTIVKSPYI